MVTLNPKTFKDIQKAQKEAKKIQLGQPPPSGLVPINDWGLYATPNEPASPWDCDRYPSSPYCGGNPLNKKPFDLSLEATVQVNPCGVTRSVTVKPTLVHVKLPEVSIAHIPPNCREEYEKQGKNYVPPPPEGKLDDYQPTPQYAPYGFDKDAVVCVVTVDQYFQETHEYYSDYKDWGISLYQVYGRTDDIKYPTGEQIRPYNPTSSTHQVTAVATVTGNVTGINSMNKVWVQRNWRGNEPHLKVGTTAFEFKMPPDLPTVNQLMGTTGKDYKLMYHYPTGNAFIYTIALWVGRFGDIFPNKQISPLRDANYVSDDGTIKRRTIHERFVVYCQKISGDSSGRLPPPIPPPRKECCEDTMGCCQPPYGNRQQQDNSQIIQLLRKIDKKLGDFPLQVTVFDANEEKKGAQTKVEKPASIAQGIKLAIERNEKLAKILGIDLLPITVPKTVIEKKGEGIFSQIFGFLDFNKNEEINSILEMQSWMFQQLSGILGHWMQEIEVETDFDPTKEGNQKKDGSTAKKNEKEKVILPNMALTMREQVVMQIQTLKSLGLIVDMQIKTLIDLAGNKVLSAECAARLEDLQLYFDYETEEVTEDLNLQVTFPDLNGKREDVENLAKFLKEGKTKVSYDRWTVNRSQSMEEKLIQLLEMSSAIRALYFHSGG